MDPIKKSKYFQYTVLACYMISGFLCGIGKWGPGLALLILTLICTYIWNNTNIGGPKDE